VKIAIATALALFLVSSLALGWLVVQGAGAAASMALAWARPAVTEAVASLPTELTPGELEGQVDRALAALREGRVDGGVVRETLAWLPAALLDGELNADEIAQLATQLERLIGAAPAGAPADASG
jgi:hypothetical protein